MSVNVKWTDGTVGIGTTMKLIVQRFDSMD